MLAVMVELPFLGSRPVMSLVLAHVTVLTVSPLLCAGWLVLLEPVSVPQPLNSPHTERQCKGKRECFFHVGVPPFLVG